MLTKYTYLYMYLYTQDKCYCSHFFPRSFRMLACFVANRFGINQYNHLNRCIRPNILYIYYIYLYHTQQILTKKKNYYDNGNMLCLSISTSFFAITCHRVSHSASLFIQLSPKVQCHIINTKSKSLHLKHCMRQIYFDKLMMMNSIQHLSASFNLLCCTMATLSVTSHVETTKYERETSINRGFHMKGVTFSSYV